MIYGIFAYDNNGGFGNQNSLPWPYLKYDMEQFVSKTINHIVVMGYNTFLSIGRPLNCLYNNCIWMGMDDLVHLMNVHKTKLNTKKDIFIIGGVKLLESTYDYIDQLLITRIQDTFICDTFINTYLIEKHFPITLYSSQQYEEKGCKYYFQIRKK